MFHVPEAQRITWGELASDASYGNNGAFLCDGKLPGRTLQIIASDGMGFEHVSVGITNRRGKSFIPNWDEMCYAKNLFWDAEDAVMQLHPPQSGWVNNHPHVLHLWRPIDQAIPLPPDVTVGNPNATPEQVRRIMTDPTLSYEEAQDRVLNL